MRLNSLIIGNYVLFSNLIALCSTSSKHNVVEETQFSNPRSFDYNFDDDVKTYADRNDIYDELVPYLPQFILHKNGKDVGFTRIPIVTRKMPTWSTPRPRITKTHFVWSTVAPITRRTHRPFIPVQRPIITTPRPRTVTHQTSLSRSWTRRTTQAPQLRSRTRSRTLKVTSRPSRVEIRQRFQTTRMRQSFTSLTRSHFTAGFPFRRKTTRIPITRRIISTTLLPTHLRRRLSTTNAPHSFRRTKSTTPTPRHTSSDHIKTTTPEVKAVAKPLLIRNPSEVYRGPTFNCKILDPRTDGSPSRYSDSSCRMKYPGFSADGKCRCTFEVDTRNKDGCPKRFLYTCIRK